MKRMLFNATQAEELRVAIVDGQKLVDLDIEHAGQEQRKSNIYKAKVTRVEPSLEAIFVDYGAERHGFLPFKELTREYVAGEDGEGTRGKIAQNLRVGQELLVQVEKDERGNKGAALTTYISLAGRYLVLMPNNPRGGGVSRRVEGEDRAELRETLDQLQVPEGMSIIARTAGIGRNAEELQWDMNYLVQLWDAIEGAGREVKGPELIYLESSLVVRAIRDLFQPDVGEILVDTQEIFEQAQSFMSTVMPSNVSKVKLYKDDVPLFSRFQIEHQIETAYRRDVSLPSGGAIIIDHTEALVSVDVNSARATKGHDIEETAFRTNCEAADEIARQLRLRDLGGLVVIDFIDMESSKNQREVENRLRDALKHDRARVQTGKISRFGLMELSRQRLQPALSESSYIPCPRCHGVGHIRDTASSALHVLRIIQEEAMKESTAAVHCQVPVDVATFLLNEKRQDIRTIEVRFKVNVLLIPNVHIETPNYEIERLRHDSEKLDVVKASYELVNKPIDELAMKLPTAAEAKPSRQEPVVKGITPDQPAPISSESAANEDRQTARASLQSAPARVATPAPSLWKRLVGLFGGKTASAATPPTVDIKANKDAKNTRDGNREGRGDRNNRAERGERNDRGPRSRNDRGDRNDRSNKGERKDGKRAEGRNEGRNGPRGDRPPMGSGGGERHQQPRQNKPDGSVNATIGAPEQSAPPPRTQQPRPALEARPPDTSEDGEGRSRRRRGRGGRGRGGREQGEPRNGATVQQHDAPAAAVGAAEFATAAMPVPASAAPPMTPAAAPSVVSAPAAVPEVQQPMVSAIAAPTVVATPSAPPAPMVSSPMTAPAAPAATVYSSATAPLAPVDQIPDVAPVRSQPRRRRERNGATHEPLVFVETDAGKAATNVQQATLAIIEPQRRSTPRPRRERTVVNEPLQVVETKPDLPPQA
ncbi:MAG: Rne/Rng family ribonuclease [Burkholderiales bacterium]